MYMTLRMHLHRIRSIGRMNGPDAMDVSDLRIVHFN